MHVIPAIDIIEGKCVRLTQGDYSQKTVYHQDPVEVAKGFEDLGITRLHLVDLDGAKARHIVNHQILARICSQTSLKVDFGGGLKSEEDVKVAFESGASQVTGGSIAVTSPEIFQSWIALYGSDRIILGADAREGMIAINGWQETSTLSLFDFIKDYVAKGIEYVICTDISRDGMLSGPSSDLYRAILKETPGLKLIASGGIGSFDDLTQLKEYGLWGAITGKAIYEGRIDLGQLNKL